MKLSEDTIAAVIGAVAAVVVFLIKGRFRKR